MEVINTFNQLYPRIELPLDIPSYTISRNYPTIFHHWDKIYSLYPLASHPKNDLFHQPGRHNKTPKRTGGLHPSPC